MKLHKKFDITKLLHQVAAMYMFIQWFSWVKRATQTVHSKAVVYFMSTQTFGDARCCLTMHSPHTCIASSHHCTWLCHLMLPAGFGVGDSQSSDPVCSEGSPQASLRVTGPSSAVSLYHALAPRGAFCTARTGHSRLGFHHYWLLSGPCCPDPATAVAREVGHWFILCGVRRMIRREISWATWMLWWYLLLL